MTRLIDADALQRKICGAKCGCEYEDCGNEGDCEFAHFIFWASTVDAKPVVYCKECVRRYDITCPMHYEEHVSHWTGDGYLESDIVEYDNTIDMGFCHLCCNGCD